MLQFDAVQTLAMGAVSLFVGHLACRHLPLLARYNIPEAVVGGLIVALCALAGHGRGTELFRFDASVQSPLMIAFFTTIGFNASVALLRVSGRQVALMLGLATAFAILQNLIGMAVATAFGLHPLFGVLAGSPTLAGGPATGLAFAPLFEQAGVRGAQSVAMAAAMAGIVAAGLVGGPAATWVIGRRGLHGPGPGSGAGDADSGDDIGVLPGDDGNAPAHTLLKTLGLILVAMWVGGWIGVGFERLGITLPAYIGAMLVGAAMRNLDDATGWLRLPLRTLETLGNVALSLFLAVALMNLKLWELSGLALPLLVLLAAQVAVAVPSCWLVFGLMGRDYDAAVMSGGFVGFILGITANAMAVMRTLVERYGAAPRAFLVVPLVGAFFIDFTNAVVITAFVNLLK
ncbi:MAG: sodium/glutamate symporter [Rudaea sp.]|uniref:sodium/glutamate symporter n=1 Tax=Rudaea sp. TaxID=2136325 RepID=UPI0039E3D23A